MSKNPSQQEGLDIHETVDGFVIYHPETDRVHFLNHTAVAVLELCNGRHTEDEIVEIVGKLYELDEPPSEEVRGILRRFADEGLVKP